MEEGRAVVLILTIEISSATTKLLKHTLNAEGILPLLTGPRVMLTFSDEQILLLLSPLEPLKRHADIRSARLENTGTWMLELESFRSWCYGNSTSSSDTNNRILACYGIKGAGKTFTRYLICPSLHLS